MVINIWICKLLFCQQFYYIRAKHKNEPWEKLLFYYSTENKYKLFRLSFLTSVLRCKFRLYSFVLMYTYRFTLSLKVDTINTENSFSHSTGKRLKKPTKIVNWLLLLNTTTDWVKKSDFRKTVICWKNLHISRQRAKENFVANLRKVKDLRENLTCRTARLNDAL